jgi:hypothetical protein
MPKPKGWTEEMLIEREEIVAELVKKGIPESRAYAIATAQVDKQHRRKEGG